MSLQTAITEKLPAWFGRTKTGGKILAEMEDAQRLITAEEEAAARGRRSKLRAELDGAIEAERNDLRIDEINARLEEIRKTGVRFAKKGFEGGDPTGERESLIRELRSRLTGHRTPQRALILELKATCPVWQATIIETARGKIDAALQAALAASFQESRLYDASAIKEALIDGSVAITQYQTRKPAIRRIIGPKGDPVDDAVFGFKATDYQNSCPRLKGEIGDLRLLACSREELQARADAIVARIPPLSTATMRARKNAEDTIIREAA